MYENIKFEIVPAEINLPAESKQSLEQSFSGFFSDAEKLKERAAEITDPAEARTARLEVKKLRIDADKKRKLLKEDSLRMGKAIDGANNILLSLIVPIEKGLEAIEKEAERAEAARLESIRQERIAILEAMSHEPHGVDIAALHVDQWEAYLQDAKDLQAIKAERENKEQAEAEAAAKAEADRLDKHRLDNIRLKAEAEAAAKEKAKADAIAAKERVCLIAEAAKERVRLIAEAAKEKAKADEASKAAATAQAKIEAIKAAEVRKLKSAKAESDAALQAEREAKQKVESAPDKARLYSFAHQVRSMIVPTAKTTQGEKVASDVSDKIKGFANWIENQADTL
tara:strand:+ start:168 stop:1190 length:1023 start_codon:yes stop_codon:yes gene_type:complete